MADAETGADADTPSTETEESRSVLIGSFRRVFAETDSRLLQLYVLVSALLGGLVALLLLLALPVWIFNTAGGSELATFSRAFLVVGGVLLLAVLAAPVVFSARRHARGTANWRTDYMLAVSGYLFVLSLYLALIVSAPPDQRGTPPAVVAPAVEFLYSLPATYAVTPPLLAALLIVVVHQFAR
jgi:hypothetical protein